MTLEAPRKGSFESHDECRNRYRIETNIYPQLAKQLVSAIAPAKLNPRVVRANMTYPRESSCSILGS